jgi:hypothetical protein
MLKAPERLVVLPFDEQEAYQGFASATPPT